MYRDASLSAGDCSLMRESCMALLYFFLSVELPLRGQPEFLEQGHQRIALGHGKSACRTLHSLRMAA